MKKAWSAVVAAGLLWLATGVQAEAPGGDSGQGITFAYYPSFKEVDVRVASAGVEGPAKAEIWKKGGERAVAGQGFVVTHGAGECVVKLPAIEDGSYEVRVVAGGHGLGVAKEFKHRNFAWVGNTLGETDVVYPPFTPILVKGDEAGVVLRDYKMNGFGLWDNVVSEGKEILAGPIVLRAETEAGEERWEFGGQGWTKTAGDAAVYQSVARTSGVEVRSTSTLEYDGCMKVEMDLLPGGTAEPVKRMWVEIPIKDEEAPLFHYTAMEGIRWNYAGETPRGGKIRWEEKPPHWSPPLWSSGTGGGSDDGVLWTCRDARPESHVTSTDFVPYIWLGGGERGIAFFGENDKGYAVDPKGVVEELERQGKVLYFRVYLVNTPTTVRTPRHVVFGLQASPAKPMPTDWRQAQRTPPHSGPVVCWGGYICADKYPDGHNFAVVDGIEKIRETGQVNNALFSQLDRQRAEPWKTPWGKGGPWLDESMRYFMRAAKDAYAPLGKNGQAYPYTVVNRYFNQVLLTYFEEHASDVSTEEWEVYQDEWRSSGPAVKRDEITPKMQPRNQWPEHQNYPASYQDFCLYYAKEWMKRGVGLYFDNTMPGTERNPRTSEAYVDAQGVVQAASPIWEQRAYYKRIRAQMMGLVSQGVSPYPLAFVQHETNTRVLPLNSWNDVSLDLEWEWDQRNNVGQTADGKEMRPFPHGLLLSETAGRQTGSIPHALYPVTGVGMDPKKHSLDVARCEWGMRAVHELLPISALNEFASYRKLEKLRQEFGYGEKGCAVFNYWEDMPAVQVNDKDVKWLLLAGAESKTLFLVLQSWHAGSVEFHVTLDKSRIGFAPAERAQDGETQENLAFDGKGFHITLPGAFGTRVVAIGGK